MSTFYIGIKMGSTTTCIYKSGNGIVLKEPSLIAMPTNMKIKDVKAIGEDAKRLIGRTPNNITIFSPISNGVIQYEELAVLMLKGFLKKIFPNKTLGQNIKAIVTTPISISPQEKKAFETTCFKAGIADVYLIPDVLSYAVGNGIDIQSETANMIVHIGGGTTNIATISNYSIINGYTLSFGGSLINVAIAKYIEETYNFYISTEQAEFLKTEICSLFETYSVSYEIAGLNKKTQSKEQLTIQSTELYPIIKHYYSLIAEAVNSVIQSSDPEVISDISKNGIYFYGGGASIIGLEKFMTEKTTFKTNLPDASRTNILGTGVLIKYPQLLKKLIKNT